MILYFSGTGNSRFVAERIGHIVEDEIVSINNRMRENNTSTLKSEKAFVLVCPVYAGRIPKVVAKHLEQTKLQGNKKVYVVVTCSETPYCSEKYVNAVFEKKGFEVAGFDFIVMPQNYIVMYDIPDEKQAEAIIRNSGSKIQSISEVIRDNGKLSCGAMGGAMMSTMINPMMYAAMVSAKKFKVSAECCGCGVCADGCPLNNIQMSEGKPKWGKDCTHCMACIMGCPKKAIEYGNKTKNRNRYFQ